MAVYSYPDFIPQLYGLTQVAYEVALLKTACQSYGWQVAIPEWVEPDDESVIEVHSPFWPAPLVALFGEQQMAGLFLFALIDEFDQEDDYSGRGQEWFNARFDDAYTEIKTVLGEPNDLGHYSGTFDHSIFSYAVWTGRFSDLVLVQHEEGDGNFGHDATIDIRIIPHDRPPLIFPLQTNLIF
jgi:hypothetical protein